MPEGDNYAIKVNTEFETPEYAIVTCKEASDNGAVITIKPNLYGNVAAKSLDELIDKYKTYSCVDSKELENIIMK